MKRVRGEVTRLLTRQSLLKIKGKALRARIWFKVPSRLERGIFDLAIRCVERIRSPVLAGIISEIVREILGTLENGFLKLAEKVGTQIAEKVCRIVERWGGENASSWRRDLSFARFLGVNAVNLKGFSVNRGQLR